MVNQKPTVETINNLNPTIKDISKLVNEKLTLLITEIMKYEDDYGQPVPMFNGILVSSNRNDFSSCDSLKLTTKNGTYNTYIHNHNDLYKCDLENKINYLSQLCGIMKFINELRTQSDKAVLNDLFIKAKYINL